jgi:hypothetical protein
MNPEMTCLAVQHKTAVFTRAAEESRRRRHSTDKDEKDQPAVLPFPRPLPARAPAG